MTVAELIEMLGRCPPDYPVNIAYDSMVCIFDVEESDSFIVHQDSASCEPGLYLCAGCVDHRDEAGGIPIPKADQKEKSE